MTNRTTRRAVSMLLSVLLCLTAFLTVPVSAADAGTPTADFTLNRDGGTVTLEFRLSGSGLTGAQCAAFAYDAKKLTLAGAKENTKLTAMTDTSAFSVPASENGKDVWAFTELAPESAKSADGGAGYLVVYPVQGGTVDYAEARTAVSVRFSCDENAALGTDAIRLLNTAEQKSLVQSVRAAVNTVSGFSTYGSLNGGDTLAAPLFSGDITVSDTGDTPAPETPWVSPFTDVPADSPYFDSVAYGCTSGLFKGQSDTVFNPEGSMTRSTFATVLCRLAGDEAAAIADTDSQKAALEKFNDCKPGWYVPYVAWGLSSGLFLGNAAGGFMPDNNITHQDMYLLIQRFCTKYGIETLPYDGVSVSSVSDAGKAAQYIKDLGVIEFAFANSLLVADKDGCIRPTEAASRWELAEVLRRLADIRSRVDEKNAGARVPVEPAKLASSAPDRTNRTTAAVVDALARGIIAGKEEIDLSQYHLSLKDIYSIYQYLVYRSEFFYLDTGFSYSPAKDGTVSMFYPEYVITGSALIEAQKYYNSALDELLSGVDPSWSDYEKILYLHDTLCINYRYNLSGEEANFDVFHLLYDKTGVCQAYALLFEELLKECGIDSCRAIYEPSDGSGEGHIWNIVCLDGSWYHVDITWDDPLYVSEKTVSREKFFDYYGQAYHDNFLRSDAGIRETGHHDWSAEHQCTDTRYDKSVIRNAITPLIPAGNGTFYYVSAEAPFCICKAAPEDPKSTETKTDIAVRYQLTGLVQCGKTLLYNTKNAICSYDPETGKQETLYNYKGEGVLCGIRLGDDAENGKDGTYTVRCLVRQDTSTMTGTEYSIRLKVETTCTVIGTVSGYFADAPVKIRLTANGTTYRTAEIARASSYLSESGTFRIEDVRVGTYDLTVEKKGCLTATLKNVRLVQNSDVSALLAGIALISGDVNGDGKIDTADSSLIVNNLHKTISGSKADLNGDTRIDILDYLITMSTGHFGMTAADCTR